MTECSEKRSCERCPHEIPVWLARFNTEYWLEALTLNHCPDGVCLQANMHLRPGTTVIVRRKEGAANAPRASVFIGLPTMVLGKVKWCRENPDAGSSSYALGIKYFPPVY